MDNEVTPVYEHNVILKEGFPCFVHYSENPQGMSPHYHPQIEIMYFYEAENVEFYCMNKTFLMNAGDMVLSNPFQIHACADFKNAHICCIIISSAVTQEFSGILLPNVIRDTEVRKYFDDIKRAHSETKKISDLYAVGAAYGLIGYLYKTYAPKQIERRETKKYAASAEAIQKALQYIDEHVTENLTLGEIASAVYLSESRFGHLFKSITGITPVDYIETVRLSNAQKMLKETKQPITEIAIDCGYDNISYFIHRFKLKTGTTPGKYRSIHTIK